MSLGVSGIWIFPGQGWLKAALELTVLELKARAAKPGTSICLHLLTGYLASTRASLRTLEGHRTT